MSLYQLVIDLLPDCIACFALWRVERVHCKSCSAVCSQCLSVWSLLETGSATTPSRCRSALSSQSPGSLHKGTRESVHEHHLYCIV